METNATPYDVTIIGGSHAGLSAAMTLGRALRRVLVIDSGKPCNASTPFSHNFLTRDGIPPAELLAIAREQVAAYPTVTQQKGLVMEVARQERFFTCQTADGAIFTSRKLIFATGLKDIMPDIEGFADCWGKTVMHCPYCHGYEAKGKVTGILANGSTGYGFIELIYNWTDNLTLYTNGSSQLTGEQTAKLQHYGIGIVEKEVVSIAHQNGQIEKLIFRDGSESKVEALYAKPETRQHCELPVGLGCEIDEHGSVKTDVFQQTCVKGVYAAGDNATTGRSVAGAVAAGAVAAMLLNHELIEEDF